LEDEEYSGYSKPDVSFQHGSPWCGSGTWDYGMDSGSQATKPDTSETGKAAVRVSSRRLFGSSLSQYEYHAIQRTLSYTLSWKMEKAEGREKAEGKKQRAEGWGMRDERKI
jgi:hypothetical protein